MAGLYIHIPFCASRCIYCGFYSTTKTNLQDRYVEALCKEMDLRKNELVLANEKINTIYIGGGTPSQLSLVNITKIFTHIYDVWGPKVDAEEVTIEILQSKIPNIINQLNNLLNTASSGQIIKNGINKSKYTREFLRELSRFSSSFSLR